MISESSLFKSLSMAHRYTARDMADLLFLYMLALHILRCEFESAPLARDYARSTLSLGNWDHVRINNTDLYQLLNVILAQNPGWTVHLRNPSASNLLLADLTLDGHTVKQFLQNIAHAGFDADRSGRLLLKIEQQLRIAVTNYKSMRRIAADWMHSHVDTHAKSLVVTRLLQALRHRAVRGDLVVPITAMAQRNKLEITGACDPETGTNCAVSPTVNTAERPSLLKQLAVGAGIGVGAYLLGKAMFGGGKK
jgi:hypothetical protein